jgi:hypothetical protein
VPTRSFAGARCRTKTIRGTRPTGFSVPTHRSGEAAMLSLMLVASGFIGVAALIIIRKRLYG